MSKIICEFCGTSYPEAATQCPICGCVRTADDNEIVSILEESAPQHEYHYVKGGRFSKKNVRKRNAAAVRKTDNDSDQNPEDKEPSNKGLVITIFVLLIAIAAVILYIGLTFFGPDSSISDYQDKTSETNYITEPTEDLRCKEISLPIEQIVLDEIGSEFQITPVLTPSNTNEQCTYYTDNDAVATVNASGLVTAIASGEATVTITCGNVSITCSVIVAEPKEPFTLAYTDVTLIALGDSCLLYDGELDPNEIIWASDDESVAVVQGGNVIAVNSGMTTIYASYNGQTASCIVYCDFEGETSEPETEEPTAPIVDNGPYQLKNAYGFSNSDVTIRTGESFTLILIDKYGDKVDGVQWMVTNGDSCSVEDGVVTGNSAGKSTVVAYFNGKEYTCLVRVS